MITDRQLIEKFVSENLEISRDLYFSKDRKDTTKLIDSIVDFSNNKNANTRINRKYISKILKQLLNVDVDNGVNNDVDIIKELEILKKMFYLLRTDFDNFKLTSNKDNKSKEIDIIQDSSDIIAKNRFTTYLTTQNKELLTIKAKTLNIPIATLINSIITDYFTRN